MKPDDRGERIAREHRPDRQRDDQRREADVEQRPVMRRGSRRRAARATICDAHAPASSTSSHTTTSFSPATTPSDVRQQAEHDQSQPEVVGLGQRVQPRERVGKAQQAQRPGEEEDRAGHDGDDRTRRSAGSSFAIRLAVVGHARHRRLHERDGRERRQQRERQRHVDDRAHARWPRPAAAARRCRRCRAAAPPSCGRRRPARAGCARARARPSRARRPMRPAGTQPWRRPASSARASRRLLLPQLLDDRLRGVEAVVLQRFLVAVDGDRARHQAGDRGERVAREPRREVQRALDESRAERQARIEHAAGDVDPGHHRLPEEVRQRARAARRSAAPPSRAGTGAGSPRSRRPWRTRPSRDRPASRSA